MWEGVEIQHCIPIPNQEKQSIQTQMHPSLEIEYRNKFRTQTLIDLINEWVELNHLNQIATNAFLLHPNPPYKYQDIRYLQHLARRIEILQELINEKN